MAAPFKSEASNITVTYNSFNLTPYCNGTDLAATVAEVDATNLASTVAESSPASTKWTIGLSGMLTKLQDDVLGKEVLTPSATKRTVVITVGTSTDTMTFTWTGTADVGGFISNYTISPTASTELIPFTGDLGISGGPVIS